jgi:hypothetical protein
MRFLYPRMSQRARFPRKWKNLLRWGNWGEREKDLFDRAQSLLRREEIYRDWEYFFLARNLNEAAAQGEEVYKLRLDLEVGEVWMMEKRPNSGRSDLLRH